jgi:hypothetical protein
MAKVTVERVNTRELGVSNQESERKPERGSKGLKTRKDEKIK